MEQGIEYRLSMINTDNNNAFNLAAFHSWDSALIGRKPENLKLT